MIAYAADGYTVTKGSLLLAECEKIIYRLYFVLYFNISFILPPYAKTPPFPIKLCPNSHESTEIFSSLLFAHCGNIKEIETEIKSKYSRSELVWLNHLTFEFCRLI